MGQATKTTDNATGAIHTAVEDVIGWIVVDHAARRNALTRAMMVQLGAAAAALDNDPAVRVIVIRGAGDRSFISGGDISQFGEMQESAGIVAEAKACTNMAFEALANMKKPLIAMINGYCLGGGMLVALEADLRIASDRVIFGIPAARLGVGYPYAAVKKLAERIGPDNAAEILLIGGHVSAERGLAMGLINKIVPSHQLEAECRELAHVIGANAPLTLRAIKYSLREYLKNPAASANKEAVRLADLCSKSQDFREGAAAFLAKRAPEFRGQ